MSALIDGVGALVAGAGELAAGADELVAGTVSACAAINAAGVLVAGAVTAGSVVLAVGVTDELTTSAAGLADGRAPVPTDSVVGNGDMALFGALQDASTANAASSAPIARDSMFRLTIAHLQECVK